MRRFFAVALFLIAVAAPVCAQRGGGRGGGAAGGRGGGFAGGRGGFSGHATFAARGGSFQAGRSRYAGASAVQRNRPVARVLAPGRGAAAANYIGSEVRSGHPTFDNRGRVGSRAGRRAGIPYLYPGPLQYGWLNYGTPWYPDGGAYYDDSANDNSANVSGPDAQSYDNQPAAQDQPVQEEPAQPSTVEPTLYDSDAVTLVFKDGRPSEQIHNYILTRTAVYVTDAHHREIPVADLDLAATEKANREAGVDFKLPQTGR